jgi:glutamyl-tRNA reductase
MKALPALARATAPGALPSARLFLWGINHRSAPLELREKLTLDDTKRARIEEILEHSSARKEHLVLDTCNRLEVYCVTRDPGFADWLHRNILQLFELDDAATAEDTYRLSGDAVIRHLFRVCSGLDSQMVGETEILGQVKLAYDRAGKRGQLGPWLHKIFQRSFQTAKWLRTHTLIGRGQVSIGNVCVELAERIFGSLRDARILLIGAGNVAEGTLHALARRDARHISITNRSDATAQRLAASHGATVIAFDSFHQALAEQDIVVSSTSAPDTMLRRAEIESLMSVRRARPLFLIDLAMPRDIDPDAGEIANVFLYNLGDLAAIANENLRARQAEIARCEQIIEERSVSLWNAWFPQVLRYFREV